MSGSLIQKFAGLAAGAGTKTGGLLYVFARMPGRSAKIESPFHPIRAREESMPQTGIGAIGEAPPGTHICLLYSNPQELMQILIAYLKAGLENNEMCIWLFSRPFTKENAESALREALPDSERWQNMGQLAIVPMNGIAMESQSPILKGLSRGGSRKPKRHWPRAIKDCESRRILPGTLMPEWLKSLVMKPPSVRQSDCVRSFRSAHFRWRDSVPARYWMSSEITDSAC